MGKLLIIKGADFSQVAVTVVTPAADGPVITISSTGSVTIVDAAAEAIYYTIDGSIPTTNSTQYNYPFTITEGTTVKAISAYSDGSTSSVVSKHFGNDTPSVWKVGTFNVGMLNDKDFTTAWNDQTNETFVFSIVTRLSSYLISLNGKSAEISVEGDYSIKTIWEWDSSTGMFIKYTNPDENTQSYSYSGTNDISITIQHKDGASTMYITDVEASNVNVTTF